MFEKFNTQQQGNVGVGKAISHFTQVGSTISIPLNDTQDYDLIVDYNDSLKKIQVKTVYSKNPYNNYVVELRTRTHMKGKLYSTKGLGDIDYLFILTNTGDEYLIPNNDIQTKTSLTLYNKYDKYKII